MSVFCALFILLTVFTLNVCVLEPPSESTIIQSARKCILTIANDHFAQRPTVSIFTTNVTNDESVLSELYRSTSHVKKLFDFSSFTVNFMDIYKDYVVLVGQTLKDFIDEKQIDKLSLWSARAKYIVFSLNNSGNLLQKFVEMFWKYYLINTIIIMPSVKNNTLLNVYSWFPYEKDLCGSNFTVKLINNCSNGILENKSNLFINKVPLDLHQCPVRIRVLIWPPFVLPPSDGKIIDNVPLNITEGVEVQMTKAIAKVANFTIEFTSSTVPHDWGLATVDGNTTGTIKALREKVVDIGMGSFGPTTERRMYCDHTVCHMQESLTWCVPIAQEGPRWKNIIETFDITSWLAMILLYCFVSCIIWGLSLFAPRDTSTYDNINNSFLFIFSAFLGISANKTPEKLSGKISFFVWLVFSLHFIAAYQAKLIGVLLRPSYEHQISSIEEVLQSGMDFQILPTHRRFYANTDDWKVSKIIKEWKSCDDSDECLRQVAYKRNSTLCTLKAHAQFEALRYRDAEGRPLVHCIDYVTYASELYMTKGFPLKARIDKLIYRIRNSGLMFKWQRDIENIWFYRFRSKNTNTDQHEQMLTTAHLLGAFVLLIFGYVISVITFLIEYILFKIQETNLIKNKPF